MNLHAIAATASAFAFGLGLCEILTGFSDTLVYVLTPLNLIFCLWNLWLV